MRKLEIVRPLLLTSCLLACSGSGDDAPAPAQPAAESSAAAKEEGAVFKDGFESGDAAEWQEPSEEEGQEDADEDAGENGGDGS